MCGAGWLALPLLLAPLHHQPVLVNVMEASMQYSDTAAQQSADAEKIFARAEHRDVWWVTGTEANNRADAQRYRAAAAQHGYRFYRGAGDAWIALDPRRATGRITTRWHTLIPGVAHVHPNRGVLRVTFHTHRLGLITILASHYNLRDATNAPIAAALGRQAHYWGRGTRLVFYGGDQNMHLRHTDSFFGAPLRTGWAGTGRYWWTHPGPETIDTVAHYIGDGRPHVTYCRSLDDAVFPLNTDHFPVEAGYTVTALS